MSQSLCAVFSIPPSDIGDDEYNRWYDGHLYEILAARGFVAARRYALALQRGTAIPAPFRYLSLYETEGAIDTVRQGLADERPNMRLPDWFDGIRFASWMGMPVGHGGDFVLPAHLYMNFSAEPDSLSFDDYSDWYGIHQDENIANTPVLVRGWRYRLSRNGPDDGDGPTHLALYELDGNVEQMRSDLGQAMASGAISLPDWFRRYASLDATAIGERVTLGQRR
jgi:hypothetical protein